ncbi:ATPase, V1 complex, subunit C [Schizopora paradoxa]|uniref:V-type proton ATPase subunit C n=1 Tax=Schizopora paradoxa TaxID=27342 RepID=A0A0H2STH7_9AGAM|nr:ATPase, V1 complex, subunit C [Schizopora paradoxa]
MPSDESTWLLAIPQDGDSEGVLQELGSKLKTQAKLPSQSIAEFAIPTFKTGTLDTLISLSEDLPKQDVLFTSIAAKIVDTLRSLLNNDPQKLGQHTLIEERSVDSYLLGGWRWNEGRYNVQKGLQDIVGTLNKEISSIDNVMKSKINNYNLAKGSLDQIRRKKTGNLSVRSLVDVVSKEDFLGDSEYLETILVAVPKALVKEWNTKYERLNSMVVPRSSRLITSDDEYSLFGVVIFRRVKDEFTQKCRENKFLVREFAYSDEQAQKQQEELDIAGTTEKELWTELLRIARTNFSEAMQILVHLKVVQLFVESVLRYGLPADYTGLVVKPEPKMGSKTLSTLTAHFKYLAPRSNNSKKSKGKKSGNDEEFLGEYQTIMEQEFFDFVVFEVPWIMN